MPELSNELQRALLEIGSLGLTDHDKFLLIKILLKDLQERHPK